MLTSSIEHSSFGPQCNGEQWYSKMLRLPDLCTIEILKFQALTCSSIFSESKPLAFVVAVGGLLLPTKCLLKIAKSPFSQEALTLQQFSLNA